MIYIDCLKGCHDDYRPCQNIMKLLLTIQTLLLKMNIILLIWKLPYHAFSSVKHIHFVLHLSLILPIQRYDDVTTSSCYIIQIAFTIPSRFQGLLHQASIMGFFIRQTSWASSTSTRTSRPSLGSSASLAESSTSSAEWWHQWHQVHVGINDNFINIVK